MFVSGNERDARSQHLASFLFNVYPRLPVLQAENLGLGNAVFRTNNRSRPRVCSNSTNICLCDLGVRMLLAEFARWCASTFFVHINRIIVCSSCPKMSGIAAWRIVARMADIQPFGDRLFSKCVSEPACSVSFVIVCQNSVSSRIPCSDPRPAFIWPFDINHLPKSDLNWFIQPNAVSRAKPFALRFWRNFFAAGFANA